MATTKNNVTELLATFEGKDFEEIGCTVYEMVAAGNLGIEDFLDVLFELSAQTDRIAEAAIVAAEAAADFLYVDADAEDEDLSDILLEKLEGAVVEYLEASLDTSDVSTEMAH